MPAVQKRPSLAAIDKKLNSGLNNKGDNLGDQVAKKAKVKATSQPSGFEEDLAQLTEEIIKKSGWFYFHYSTYLGTNVSRFL